MNTVIHRLRDALCCPACGGTLREAGEFMICDRCQTTYPVEGQILRLIAPSARAQREFAFYNEPDEGRYGRDAAGMTEQFIVPVRSFLAEIPSDALVLEIGAGRGAFDGAHPGYVGLDFSILPLRGDWSGPRVQADARALPFRSETLGAVVTVATLEHVPEPGAALAEIDRCLLPGGRAFIYPAWYVRPWAAKGLATRTYQGLSIADRVRKASIPLRDTRGFQFAKVLPGRLVRELALRREATVHLAYRELSPTLDRYLTSDSDAFNSLDPHAVSAYFLSRGYRDLGRTSTHRRLLYGYEPVIVGKPADD